MATPLGGGQLAGGRRLRQFPYRDSDHKHTSSATSTLDVLWVLYDQVLCVAPATMDDPDRDRFLRSQGHGPRAYYAVLAATGFIPIEWWDTFGQLDSPLGYHPDRMLIPGAEISSGSLGHGLPIAVGVALGQRTQGSRGRTYVVVLVEPYLAGTSTRLIDQALSDRPHRTLALGVSRTEQRRYGTPEQHDALHGLDTIGLRRSLSEFLTLEKTHTKGPVQ